ncbi:MAG: LamG domain-containing protein, partial [Candidatus Accumulibacter sp.]|nr:LamG domain-containing protein [Accumulibacter sp.]
VSGQLDPANETDVYTFDATAGTRYYIDRQTLSSGADRLTWRLFDPYGRQVFGPSNLNDVDIFTLGESGAYTLIVEGRIWQTQYGARTDYSFKLLEITDDIVDIVPGVSHGLDQFATDGQLDGALNVNGLRYAQVANNADLDLTGSLTLEAWFRVDAYASTWQALFYKGNGNSNQRTYTLWLNSAGYLHLSTGNNSNNNINTANGSVVTGQWHHVAVVLDRDSATGVMKIYLDGLEAASGALSTGAASSNANPLLIGSNLENYPVFQGAVDDVRLWNSARSAQQIVDNKDHTLVGNEAGLLMYLKADESSGTALADSSGRGNAGQIVHPWASTPGVVAGRIDFGQQDYYRFTLGDSTRLYFDSLTDNNNLRWYLSGPRGVLVSDRSFQGSDSQNGLSVFDLVAGDYTLRVDGVGDTTADYGFRLIDLAGAEALPLDSTVNGLLTPANRTDAYQFSANAGDRLYFDVVATSGGVPYWRLLDPWGRTVWGPSYMPSDDVQLQTLPFTGVYTLLVEGRRDAGTGSSGYALHVGTVTDKTVAIAPGVASGMTAERVDGELGGGVDLNGFQYLEVANSSSIDLTGSLTVEAWIRLDHFTNTWQPIFYKGDASSDWTRRSYAMWLNSDGSLQFGSDSRYTGTAAGVVQAGVWTHVAGTIDRATGSLRIYVNGDQAAARDNIGTAPSTAYDQPLLLGGGLYQSSDSNLFAGALDEVRIWNTARSQAQIQAARDTPLNGSEAGLVLYLKADEGSGETLADLSGDGNPALFRAIADGIVLGSVDHAGQVVNHNFSL